MISSVLLDARTGRPIVARDLRAALAERGVGHIAEYLERARLDPRLTAAERTPPLYMDVSNAYSGDELGLPNRDMVSEGIVGVTDLAVTGHAAANSIDIAKGTAWVLGDTNTDLQPNYRCFNDAIVNLGISPDATNPRRVLVIAQVTDQAFAGTGRTWALQAVHGTPAGSPVVPATPASALPLANILVPAAAASSAAYTITDLRFRATIGGNIVPPSARAYSTVNLATTSGVGLVLNLNAERWDYDQMHDLVTNTSRLTVRTPGNYLIHGQAQFASSAAGTLRTVEILANGAILEQDRRPPLGGGYGTQCSATTEAGLVAGDYVELRAFQDSGGALNVLAGPGGTAPYSPELMMTRLSI